MFLCSMCGFFTWCWLEGRAFARLPTGIETRVEVCASASTSSSRAGRIYTSQGCVVSEEASDSWNGIPVPLTSRHLILNVSDSCEATINCPQTYVEVTNRILSRKREGPYAWANHATLSVDGRSYAYIAGALNNYAMNSFVVVNGRASSSRYRWISDLRFDLEGNLAYYSCNDACFKTIIEL